MSDYNTPKKDDNSMSPKSDQREDKNESQRKAISGNENQANEKRAQDGTVQQHGKLESPAQATNSLGTQAKNPALDNTRDQQAQAKPAQADKESCTTDTENKAKK